MYIPALDKSVPASVLIAFEEAMECHFIGSVNGLNACLKNTLYCLCDDKAQSGTTYKEKLKNLPIQGAYQELLEQIIWIESPSLERSNNKHLLKKSRLAFKALGRIINEIYANERRIRQTEDLIDRIALSNMDFSTLQ